MGHCANLTRLDGGLGETDESSRHTWGPSVRYYSQPVIGLPWRLPFPPFHYFSLNFLQSLHARKAGWGICAATDLFILLTVSSLLTRVVLKPEFHDFLSSLTIPTPHYLQAPEEQNSRIGDVRKGKNTGFLSAASCAFLVTFLLRFTEKWHYEPSAQGKKGKTTTWVVYHF